MQTRWFLGAAVALVALPSAALADQVGLKNGDRLTGMILQLDGGTLALKSEFAGEVKIKWVGVETLRSEQPMSVTLRDDRVVSGRLELAGGSLAIRPDGAEPTTIAADVITAIRTVADQTAFVARR